MLYTPHITDELVYLKSLYENFILLIPEMETFRLFMESLPKRADAHQIFGYLALSEYSPL